jgi:hypothetical protein
MGGGCVARQLYPQPRKRPIDNSQRGFVPLALVGSPRGEYRIRGAIAAARAHSLTNQSNRPSNGERPAGWSDHPRYAIAFGDVVLRDVAGCTAVHTASAMRLP